ncbi:ABC-2 type transport system permease protein [Crossiella equi]|uniref:Transport permease protein n=1 Tax=Crossiella equi TaxID=130796 RepID=A0ABS5A418_9PSEU|nr:ABC transporter permease [Crossiella equi]MBP2471316.1 ABC-2 type transport system permease protein [Crossiella equi]
MTTATLPLRDSVTMFRRDLRHALRYPLLTVSTVIMPLFMLLLFVLVFGNAVGGAVTAAGGNANYLDYLTPGILVMAIGSASGSAVAIKISSDMQEGIIDRFRTMSIPRAAVLWGQVLGSLGRTLASLVLVTVVALVLGFRPTAGPGEWLLALGLVVLFAVAVTWLAVAAGLVAKTPGGANSAAFPLQMLPFLSSAFVQPAAMSPGMAALADWQPFTPVIDTLRGLLTGTPIGYSWLLALGWCLVLTGLGYGLAIRRYQRD